MSSEKSYTVQLTVGALIIFGVIWLWQSTQDGRPIGVSGMVTAVSNALDILPDHPTTQQMIDWENKCQQHAATGETCSRLNMIVQARIQACQARMGIRDWIVSIPNISNSPVSQLKFCEQRFPDMPDAQQAPQIVETRQIQLPPQPQPGPQPFRFCMSTEDIPGVEHQYVYNIREWAPRNDGLCYQEDTPADVTTSVYGDHFHGGLLGCTISFFKIWKPRADGMCWAEDAPK